MFRDRLDGAEALARAIEDRFAALDESQRRRPIVLGLPRGGVPIAAEVAEVLGWPWDVLIVRKIGAPDQPELALGAVGEGGVTVRHEAMVGLFDESAVARITEREHERVIERTALFRRGRDMADVRARSVVIVDDGLATGATMAAAVTVARHLGAARVIAAAPVGSSHAVNWLRRIADEVICVQVPSLFMSVGQQYQNFDQVTDDEVIDLLAART